MRLRRLASVGVDAALVLLIWVGAVLVEDVAVGFLFRDQFSGPWEISQARHLVGRGAVLVACAAMDGILQTFFGT